MLKKKILTYEWVLVIFFVMQIIWSGYFSPKLSWILFGIFLSIKHFFEGFRLNFVLFIITQGLFTLLDNTLIRLALLALPIFAVYYFPLFRFPRAMGIFFAAFKVLKIRNTDISVYYPTSALTEPVPLSPSKKAWLRFHRLMKSAGTKVPEFIFRFGLSYLEHMQLPVQNESKIVSKEHLTLGRKFSVILFSHGIACNRNMYTSIAREWASNGYIVFSIDHEEDIDYPAHFTTEQINAYRFNQIKKRKEIISRVLDYITKPENLQDFFEDSGFEIDPKKISIVGQSLGGAAAVYTAINDKRITGVCLLLDPWIDFIYDEIKGKSIGIPTLVIRTPSDDGNFRVGHDNKEMMSELIANNREYLKQSLSCYFEGATHISQTDLVLHMPRECVLFKVMKAIGDIEDTLVMNNKLTQMYLDTMLYEKDPRGMPPEVVTVLKKFNSYAKKAGKKNKLIVDGLPK